MKGLWKVGKEDRSKLYWEISRGQDLGLSIEQIPFGKQRDMCTKDKMTVAVILLC